MTNSVSTVFAQLPCDKIANYTVLGSFIRGLNYGLKNQKVHAIKEKTEKIILDPSCKYGGHAGYMGKKLIEPYQKNPEKLLSFIPMYDSYQRYKAYPDHLKQTLPLFFFMENCEEYFKTK